jgi:hypothetical protein
MYQANFPLGKNWWTLKLITFFDVVPRI